MARSSVAMRSSYQCFLGTNPEAVSSNFVDGASIARGSAGSGFAGISLLGWPHSASAAELPDPAYMKSWSWPIQLNLNLVNSRINLPRFPKCKWSIYHRIGQLVLPTRYFPSTCASRPSLS